MTPALQPTLHPRSLRLRRWLVLATGLALLLALGLWQQQRRHPPRLLLTEQRSADPYLRRVHRLFERAERRIWITLFVLRPSDDADGVVADLIDALGRAHRRGVDVRVTLDYGRRWDTGAIEDKHAAAVTLLAAQGIEATLDELDRTTHSKVILVDERWAVVGSHNWTRSALLHNRETSVLIDDPALVAQLAAHWPQPANNN